MEGWNSLPQMKTMKSELRKKQAVSPVCRCVKNKIWIRPTDLRQPNNSWLRKMILPCKCDSSLCECDTVLSIPYGYFLKMDSKLEKGDTIGPDSTYVRLISKDKFRFIIKRKWTNNCLLLNSWFTHENQTGFDEEAQVTLKKYSSLCVYYLSIFLMYKYDYEKGHLPPEKEFVVPDNLLYDMWEVAHDLIV